MDDLRQLIPFLPLIRFIRSLLQYGFPRQLRIQLVAIWFTKLIVMEPFRWIGEWRWMLAKKDPPEDPLFVLGFYRSGTTYLQQLLSRHPKMATLTLFHSVLPELMGLREIFIPVFNFITHLLRLENPYHRLPLQWDFPGEDDVAINASVSASDFNRLFQYPSTIDQALLEYIDFLDERKKQSWVREHKRLVARLAYMNPGKRLILKSPPNTGRISLLRKHYPKAKFIFIYRSPSEVIPSARRIWNLNETFCFESYTTRMADDFSIKLYEKFHDKFIEGRKMLSAEDLIEVAYSDFVKQTEDELRKIFTTLKLGDFQHGLNNFRALIEERKDYLVQR